MLQQFFKIRICEKGWLEYQLNLCSIRLQQQNVACTIVITWRPEFQNVQGLPWQEYYVMILGMQAALIRQNWFWFKFCSLTLSYQDFISVLCCGSLCMASRFPPQTSQREKKTEYHDVSAGWEIHRWMRLQAA